MSDETQVPLEMPDIGGQTYLSVFRTKPIFVDFVVCEISQCTGFFKQFQEYCIAKIKRDGERFKQDHRGTEEKES